MISLRTRPDLEDPGGFAPHSRPRLGGVGFLVERGSVDPKHHKARETAVAGFT
jgi:hypothetical protein